MNTPLFKGIDEFRSLSSFKRPDFHLTPEVPIKVHHKINDKQGSKFQDLHYVPEAGCVIKGSVRRKYQGCYFDLEPGDIWINGIWEPHGQEILKAPCEMVLITFLPEMFFPSVHDTFDWLTPFFTPPSQRPWCNPAIRPRVLRIANDLLNVNAANHTECIAWQKTLLQELLLTHRDGWAVNSAQIVENMEIYQRIERAIRLVFESKEFLPVEKAASVCGMSRNIFATHFRRVTGMAFAEFALRYRLTAVAYALETGNAPLKAMSREWGFTDQSHLHRCFVKLYGIPPGEYRNVKPHEKRQYPK